ncbi:DUF1844 domain-containing protein [Balneolaceae bacterium ANBcel3]|nr:DUF1844 domain-containing protein [Balneolaceae bacterium ANBcel3]
MSKENTNNNPKEEQQNTVLMMMLIQQHQQIGLMGLGEMEHPATGKKEKDLKTVKYAIDTLHMLEVYTKGNLPDELAEYLGKTLTDLRIKYVDAGKES